MIDENALIDDDELNIKRADTAARVRRYRARKELEQEALSVKQMMKLKAAKAQALSATVATAGSALQHLTPEERAIFDSQLFKEGADDGSSAGLEYLCSLLYRTIEAVKMDSFDDVRADWDLEFYEDFIQTYPWAKPLVYPRVKFADRDDPESPTAYPMAEFHSVLAKWSAWKSNTPTLTLMDEEPTVKRRKRGRPPKATRAPMETAAIDPAVVESWSKPPALPQADHWASVTADRVADAVKREREAAGLDGMI